jgi:hypothetical protein
MPGGKKHKKAGRKHKKASRRKSKTAGSKSRSVNRNLSVFINCPYDPGYQPIFDGIVFATVCCGYKPRSALETSDVAEPRMKRIVQALKESKYSIHDLCRCQGHGDKNLARMNMPLELGIAMAERFDANRPDNWHDWLVLVPTGNDYASYVSDLAGYDPKQIEEKVEEAISAVMSWLLTRKDAVVVSAVPKDILALVPKFMEARQKLHAEWNGHEPWPEVVKTAIEIGQKGALIPAIKDDYRADRARTVKTHQRGFNSLLLAHSR